MKWNTKKVAIVSGVLGFAVSFAIGLQKSIKENKELDEKIEHDAEEIVKDFHKAQADQVHEAFQKVIDDYDEKSSEIVKQFKEELKEFRIKYTPDSKPDSEDEAE